jgi:hypothetical protein
MIEEMASLLENFPGAANQTRCFLHILNLTAKSILQQFEIPKKKKTGDGGGDGDGEGGDDGGKKYLSKALNELMALSNEIEDEPTVTGVEDGDEGTDLRVEDDEDGLEDEREVLSEEEIAQLEADLIPVRLMLTKVRESDDDSAKNFLILIMISFEASQML